MTTNRIDGLTVEDSGGGTPVIMIHGLGGTANTWQPQVDALSGRYRLIRPDLPGSGRSAHAGALSIAGFADAVLGLIETLNLAPAHLVGHSLGTIVCQHVAARRPDAVASLALFGPIHAPPDAARAALKDRAAKARREGMGEIAEAIVAGSTAAATKRERPAAVAFVRESVMRQEPEGYAATCEALAGAEAADLSRIACPVLLRTGDEDAVAPKTGMTAIADALRAADAASFDACGHWATVEVPERTSRALADFLARQR